MTTTAKRATFLASLGAGLEYYDFIIYGMMAGTLSTLFFPSDLSWVGTMKAFAVFAVGYLARPFGGIIFGAIGDVFGRKRTFTSVMLLMALSTFTIGLLPTFEEIGGLAAVLLIILRLLQGLSFGAEMPGAITVICEYAEKKSHGTYSGFVVSSVSLGTMLASFVLYIVTNHMTPEQLMSWGWRVPFLIGGLLAIVNYVIRKQLDETPEYVKSGGTTVVKTLKTPLRAIIKSWLPQIGLGVGMTAFLANMVIFVMYMPTYLNLYYSYDPSAIYLAMTYGLIWSAVSLPVCGWLSDRISKERLYVATAFVSVVGVFPLFSLLKIGGFSVLVIFMCIYQTAISLVSVCYFPIMASLFPVSVRYTGIAACYNIAYSLMGASPLLITTLIAFTQSASSALWFLIGCATIGAGCCLLLKRSLARAVPAE